MLSHDEQVSFNYVDNHQTNPLKLLTILVNINGSTETTRE